MPRASRPKVCKNLTIMQNYLSMDGLYINDFHRSNSMAAQREVRRMSLHPFSREQKLRQIEMLHNASNRINTPELRSGGTRTLTTEVEIL